MRGICFFFQAEDGIRDAQESRGLGDVYKRQVLNCSPIALTAPLITAVSKPKRNPPSAAVAATRTCLLYTSDAADDLLCVDLGGRRII